MTEETQPLHPRLQTRFLGNAEARETFRKAFSQTRMHHGWLICGPKGVGKATLAYRLARQILKGEARDIPETDPVSRQVAALSHPDFLVLEGDEESGAPVIKIEQAQEARRFFSKTAAMGGWRVCLIDAADDMNIHAANALLKILEEPPPRAIFLLLAHRPGGLLPTIRSRCARLSLHPLADDDMRRILASEAPDASEESLQQACRFAEGAPGRALSYLLRGGVELHNMASDFLASLPNPDPQAMRQISLHFAKKERARDSYLFLDILAETLLSSIREGRGWSVSAALKLWETVQTYRREMEHINMNRAHGVLNVCLLFEKEAKRMASARGKG